MAYGSVLRLGDEEVQNTRLDEAPDTEDDVGLPGNVLERHRNTKLHNKHSYVVEYVSTTALASLC